MPSTTALTALRHLDERLESLPVEQVAGIEVTHGGAPGPTASTFAPAAPRRPSPGLFGRDDERRAGDVNSGPSAGAPPVEQRAQRRAGGALVHRER
jgi:hypothetical protein